MTSPVRYAFVTMVVVFALSSGAQFQKQSPGAALESAARESGKKRPESEPNPNGESEKTVGGADILTPTDGFDMTPYVKAIKPNILRNWERFIPASARVTTQKSPWSRRSKLKRGTVIVEFSIQRDGSLGFTQITESSGDEEMDAAALAGITESAPFPHLPEKLKSDTVRMRIHFYYNPFGMPQEKTHDNASGR